MGFFDGLFGGGAPQGGEQSQQQEQIQTQDMYCVNCLHADFYPVDGMEGYMQLTCKYAGQIGGPVMFEGELAECPDALYGGACKGASYVSKY